MHGSSSHGPGKKARIEIIPLIDVIFFLLATFVLFTLSLNKSDGLPVSLPQVSSGEARDPANTVTITVTEGGTLAWNKETVTLDEFITKLQTYAATEPEPNVLLNGDERATFAQAIYAFDEVRKAGIDKIRIETRIRPLPAN